MHLEVHLRGLSAHVPGPLQIVREDPLPQRGHHAHHEADVVHRGERLVQRLALLVEVVHVRARHTVAAVGARGCLTHKGTALTFVITGTLDSLEREECEALIAKYGGRHTSAVSGKTNYVIQGTDDTGMPFEGGKVKTARDKHAATCKIIDEDGLLDLIRASAPQPEPEPQAAPPAAPPTSSPLRQYLRPGPQLAALTRAAR